MNALQRTNPAQAAMLAAEAAAEAASDARYFAAEAAGCDDARRDAEADFRDRFAEDRS